MTSSYCHKHTNLVISFSTHDKLDRLKLGKNRPLCDIILEQRTFTKGRSSESGLLLGRLPGGVEGE